MFRKICAAAIFISVFCFNSYAESTGPTWVKNVLISTEEEKAIVIVNDNRSDNTHRNFCLDLNENVTTVTLLQYALVKRAIERGALVYIDYDPDSLIITPLGYACFKIRLIVEGDISEW